MVARSLGGERSTNEWQERFWRYGTVLYLNCISGYTNLLMCQNSQNFILEKKSILLYVNLKVILKTKQGKS